MVARACIPWTPEQVALVRDNPTMQLCKLVPLVNDAGPPRSRSAVSDRRGKLTHGDHMDARRKVASGWPSVPPREMADRVFLQALLTALQAEGRAAA